MKAKKRYRIGHYTDREGRDCYAIHYKRDALPWMQLATTHHKEVAEQVVERLKADDEKLKRLLSETFSTASEEPIQQVLAAYPQLTRAEALEMLRAFGAL